MAEQDLPEELHQAKEDIEALRRRLEALEQNFGSIPDTRLLDKSFFTRTLAVVGHHFVGSIYLSVLLLVGLVLLKACQ